MGTTIPVELNETAARLLARLCVELGTEDAAGVVSRALGVLDMCMRQKQRGARLCWVNDRGEQSDVVF